MTDERGPTPRGVDDAGAADGDASSRVRRFLFDHGVDEADVAAAEREGQLHLLVAERVVIPDRERYTPIEVAERAGIPLDDLRRLWRGLGFREVADDEIGFSDTDVTALATLHGVMELGLADLDTAVQLARVIGWSMMRIAEAELAAGRKAAEGTDSATRAELFATTADLTLPAMARLLEYVWRRHFQAAVRRAMLLDEAALASGRVQLAVGFVDLVGFTTLSQQLSDDALAELVTRFEGIAHEAITEAGGRVVKTIGDEVMFVAGDAAATVALGVELSERIGGDDALSQVRVGIAYGDVLLRDGDYYGAVVNLAARLVGVASPGAVVVSDAVRRAAGDDAPDIEWVSLRTRYLKDIGRVPLWSVRRAVERTPSDGESGRPERPSLLELLSEAGREAIERRARKFAEEVVNELDERADGRRR